MQKEVYAKIHGNVQGVSFRQFARNKALELSVTGYVKNMPDGSVDIIGQGEEEKVKAFVEAISAGPEEAEVESLELVWGKPSSDFATFTIEHNI